MNRADDLIRRRYETSAPVFDVRSELDRFATAIEQGRARRRRTRLRLATVGMTCVVLAVICVAAIQGIRYLDTDDTWTFGDPPFSGPAGALLGEIEVDLGSSASINLTQAWDQIAGVAGVDAYAASFSRLDLSFAPSAALLWIGIQGETTDGKVVTLGWDGTNGPRDQSVVVTGDIRVAEDDRPQIGNIRETLAALDKVGVDKLISQSAVTGPGGTYNISTLQESMWQIEGIELSIPGSAQAYLWNGSDFAPLASEDSRRVLDASRVYLGVYPMKLVSSNDGDGQDTGSDKVFQALEVTWFVIPSE
jgi:hypothetical protein